MKFEKFLKGCGTYGQILTRENGDKWLVCGGVGMKVPAGVVNLLGTGEVSEKVKNIVEALIKADTDDKVKLTRATVEKDGKAFIDKDACIECGACAGACPVEAPQPEA